MVKQVLGIDEVGRGPWAGPLVVGAVILGEDFTELPEYQELRDSKKIAKKKRERLAQVIQEKALGCELGWVTAVEIDRYGLGPALKLAARRAVKKLLAKKCRFDSIVIDGTINLLANTPLEDRVNLLPKADNLVKEVSAASIVAKVARDQYMSKLTEKYPEYGFDKHVGYGTARHREALEEYGICPEHRQSFRPIAKIAEKRSAENQQKEHIGHGVKSTTTIAKNVDRKPLEKDNTFQSEIGRKNQKSGHLAEDSIMSYLCQQEHSIIAKNHKTKSYEIDLISTNNEKIYFTEVKYRENPENGNPLEQITSQKLEKMRYASEKFLQDHPEFQNFQPILAVAGVTGKNFEVEEWFELG